MKKKLIYEVLIGLSVILVFVCVALRVGEIIQENTDQENNSAESITSQNNDPSLVETPPSTNDQKVDVIIRLYGGTIRQYAAKYDIDWRLVLAVIRQESRFSTQAESQRGAIGLMQLMPNTFEDIADEMGLADIMDPANNIKAGIKHLATLSESFENVGDADRTRLTLAAYNAGIGRVQDAQQLAHYLNDNPNSWEGVRSALPLLSKRFMTLHERVWENDRPPTGYFRDFRQTIKYVDRVMAFYDDYRQRYD